MYNQNQQPTMAVEDMNSGPQTLYIEKKKSRKRKKFIAGNVETEQEERHLLGDPSKLRFSCQRVEENDDGSIDLKEGSPWRNLQLILSLQDKNMDVLRKIGLAFNYAKTSNVGEMYDSSQCSQVMNTSRTLVYLNNWVHSVLISSEKKIRLEENKCKFNTSGSYLDFRCWKILHFCLEQSKDLHISLTCSKDFLRVVCCITMDASSYVNDVSSCHTGTLSDERLEFYDVVLGCTKLIFSFHGGVANENLDLWMILIDELLELILKMVQGQLDGSKLGHFVFQLSYSLLEPFAKFLRVHPPRKNGFRDFIDKLFESLLRLLHVLHCDPCGNNIAWRNNLSKLIKDVLAHGLFHPTHIDGFLSIQSTVRYRNASDATLREEKLVNKSYHRHLFDKVETMVEKNESALIGLGQLLHLFVSCIAKHKGASFCVGVFRQSDVRSTRVPSDISQRRIVSMKENSECHVMNAELRSCVFYFFAQIMEYLLANINTFLQSDVEEVPVLLNNSNTLRSISMLLDSVFTEKVYLRLEDTSDKTSRKFLKVIYDVVMLLFAKITHLELSYFGSDERSLRELLVSARKELIITVRHLLNIEYEVVGDDLEKLWTVVLTSMNCSYRSTDVFDQPVLSFEILSLGCRLIDLYSELRQVNSSISALCKAVRNSTSILGDDESCTPLHHWSSYSNAINMLLCSLEFRLSLSNAIKTIPEGQTAECVHHLSSDIMESVEWMKFEHQLGGADEISKPKLLCSNSEHFDLRAEILGRALSEVYLIILDSMTVNSGNSYLVGVSVKNLIEIISSSLSNVVSLQSYAIKNFSIVVDGRALRNRAGCKNVSTCWILVFLCRLLLSCRSLFRKSISLIPPGTSKKLSRLIGDSFTLHSARDWLELSGLADKGSFSLILQPSASFLDVIRSISSICIQDSAVLCPPLVYILNAMATMRLVDLNKLIASSEYVLHWNQICNQSKLKDEAGLSSFPKRIRKWTRHVSEMKEEAADLTKFMMEFLSSVSKDLISTSSVDTGIDDKFIQCLSNNGLNFSVGFINEESFPCALLWIICQNVDIWCSHATRKELKNFVTLLIKASISNVRNAVDLARVHNIGKPGHMKKVTTQQIALEFLSNTITYEQRFVCRYMASRFCAILQKSALFLSVTPEVDLSESPDWDEVISAVGNFSDEGIGYPLAQPSTVPDESCSELFNVNFSKCQCLLTLLMWMPEDFFRLRSSSLYITCILNLERLLVGSLLRWRGALNMQSTLEIFRLFVLCRRVLKNLTAASCKENINGQPELPSKLPEYSFPLSWLPKSLFVVIGFRCAFPEDTSFEGQFSSCSLMDHTSNALLIVSRDKFASAFSSCISSKKLHRKRKELKLNTKESDLSECTRLVNHHENLAAGKSLIHVAKILEEFLKNLLDNFVDTCADKKVESLAGLQELNKISAIMACFQGLFWGLASALVDINADNFDLRIKLSSHNADLMTKIDSWVHMCVNFIFFCLKAVLLEEITVLNMPVCDNNVLGTRESSTGGYDCSADASGVGVMHPNEKIIPFDIKGDIVECNLKRDPHPVIPKLEALLTEVQHEKICVKKNLLLELLRGGNADIGFFLQQLFIACSAVLRLNLQINLNSIFWGWVPIVVNISQHLLLEFSSSCEMTNQFAFVWLLGVVKFLEELGSYFSQFDPSLSRDLYVKLIGLHIMAIGKCISLQGKEATLTSQERGLHVKMLASTVQSYLSQETSKLVELKTRLRISFTSYIRKSSELHLLSAVQAVERALVGVQEGLMTNYEIRCGSSDGGEVSADVAAGVDCLYLILEFVTGHRRLNMIKRHIQSFVACLFNVILHLQAPSIFRGYIDSIKACGGPDPGSVVLMCVEVLTKVYGKPTFQIEAYHIAQSLRVPAPLFQYFLSLQISEAPVIIASGINSNADQKFSAELYSACCRLLCTALKHHKNETRQFISLLEDSVSVLLHSLEIVNIDPVVERASYAWEVSKAVECASSLRRVYEEVRQEKELFGPHAFKFLSRYIWVYCGHGPAKRGIRREVEEALKPGIYALLDSCSVEDLQLLHTVFEEGPCRSTLAALQHDYKLNFQFLGKV